MSYTADVDRPTPNPSSDNPKPTAPRWLRRGAWWLLVVFTLGGLWTLIDRGISRTLASQLSDRLGASVRLGGWKVLADDRFELTDLVVRGRIAGYPYRFVTDRVRVDGNPNDIRRGSIESLRFEGARLSLLVPARPSAEEDPSEMPFIGQLAVPGLRLFVCTTGEGDDVLSRCDSASAEAAMVLDASFRDIGTEPRGTLSLTGERIELLDFPASGRLLAENLKLAAELDDGSWSARGSSERLHVVGPSYDIDVSRPRWHGGQQRAEGWKTEPIVSQTVTTRLGDLVFEIPSIEGRPVAGAGPGDAPDLLELSSPLWRRMEVSRRVSDSGDQELGLRVEGLKSALIREALQQRLGIDLNGTVDGFVELSRPVARSRPIPWTADLSFSGHAADTAGETALSGPGTFRLAARGETYPEDPWTTRATFEGSYDIPGLNLPPAMRVPEDWLPTQASWRGVLRDERIDLEDATWRAAIGSCRSSADIELAGSDDEPRRKIQAYCNGSVKAALSYLDMEPTAASASLWKAKTTLSWRGRPRDISGTVSIQLPAEVELDGFQIAEAQISTTLRLRERSQGTTAELSDATLQVQGGPTDAPTPLRAAGSFSARALVGTDDAVDWRVDRFELGLSDADRPPDEPPQILLSGRKGADSATLQLILERLENRPAWVDSRLPPAAAELSTQGRLQVDGDLTWTGGSWAFEGPMNLTELGLSNPEGSRVLEGLSTEARLTASGRPRASAPLSELRLVGSTGGFLVLWQTLFADFEDFSSDFKLALTSMQTGTAPPRWTMDGAVRLPHGSELRLAFDQGTSGFELAADLDDLSAFHRQVVSRLQDDPPLFKSMSGAARLRLAGELSLDPSGELADWSARGRLSIDDADLELSSGNLDSLRMDLPVDIRVEDGAASGGDQRGSLSLGASNLFGLSLPAIKTQLRVEGDDLTLQNPLRLDLLGGAVELRRLSFRDLLSPDRFMRSALSLEGISLERLTTAYGLPTFEGLLEGELPSVSVTGQTLRVEGGGRLKLLGGEVEIRDISGSEIFTPFPQFKLSADLRRISLDRLTARFDFGRVTGLLSGTLEDCALFRGIPTAFRAQFRTVPEKGVKQTVDVKAVKNLTILGTGQGSNLFDQGIQRFLSRYRYAALGVAVHLEDDVLRLDGLEHRGEKELFLRGAFPFGIDIVNARPGQTVSFQTMVERLKALDFERVKIGEQETTP